MVVLASVLSVSALSGPTSASAMTHGVPVADPGVAPWLATVAPADTSSPLDDAVCDGALVAPDRVLTSARCADGLDPSRARVYLGARRLTADHGPARGVRGIAVLPGYRRDPSPATPGDPDNDRARYDLAVLLLDRPADVAFLPVARHSARPGGAVAMFGHGLTGIGGAQARPDMLHRGDLTVVARRDCAADDSALCVADRSARVAGCRLDSGSPLVSSAAGRPELVGAYSFGSESTGVDCVPGAPMAVADAAAFRGWILGPLPERMPYPLQSPMVTRVGNTMRCAMPGWDTSRGSLPDRVSTSWAALVPEGTALRQFPVDADASAATDKTTGPLSTLRLAPDLHLAGNPVSCVVTARTSGGSVRIASEGVTVSAGPGPGARQTRGG